MKTYRLKHAAEAMRWTDTDENREAFAAWFESHDTMFVTRGPEVVLQLSHETVTLAEGGWILFADDEFCPISDEEFRETYEEIA